MRRINHSKHDAQQAYANSIKQKRVPLAPIDNKIISLKEVIFVDDYSSSGEEDDAVELIIPERFIHVEYQIGNPEDAQDVTEYEHIIYRSMRRRELKFPFTSIEQAEFTEYDVALLIDCLDRLHFKFQLTTNTIYRCVGVLRRVLALKVITAEQLLIYGCASLLVASKQEDVNPIYASDITLYFENKFSMEDIKNAEMDVLITIKYDVAFPTSLFFLLHFLRLDNQEQDAVLLSRYLLELCLTQHEFAFQKPSAVASSVIMMMRTLANVEPWPECYVLFTQYTFDDLCQNVNLLHNILLQDDRKESQFITNKYSTDLFHYVSQTIIPEKLPIPYPYFE